jgi:acyl-CoA synthetase (AMP-forming)/AMP-acid ligase II
MAITDFFDRGWQANPHGTAYVQDERRYSFRNTGELSCRVANALICNGYGKGAKGVVWADNDVGAWACVLGLWRAGMAHIPIDVRDMPEENQVVLNTFDCEIVFFQQAHAGIVNESRSRLPKVRRWVCIDANLPWAPSLAEWSDGQPATPPRVEIDEDDVALLTAAGGAAGMTRGALITHRALQTEVAQFMRLHPYDGTLPVHLAVVPLTQAAGLLSLACTARGGTVVVATSPDAGSVLDAIAKHKVTELFMRPAMLCRLLGMTRIGKPDVSSLRYFLYEAAPTPAVKRKRALEMFGPVMAGIYGRIGASGTIAYLPPADHVVDGRPASEERLSSVGRPTPLVRVAITNEHDEIVKQGETGEICVRGDQALTGFYNAPNKTAETIVDGWFHTGDLGHLDDEGYLHVTGRKKDVIVSAGFDICAREIEAVIWAHPAVQDCAVIGVPDEQWGEAVKAVVELNAGTSVSASELVALCRQRLGSAKTPRSVDFVSALPRSQVGMVLKKALRAQYR